MTQSTECSDLTAQAEALLRQVNAWNKEHRFGHACEQLASFLKKHRGPLLSGKMARRLSQAQSLSTYKNQDLPPLKRYEDALDILNSADTLETSTDPETLGQAGAIHKRLWQHRARLSDLQASQHYYRRGAQLDSSYCMINLVFLLELWAQQMPEASKKSIEEADCYREKLTLMFEARSTEVLTWWQCVTAAEAYLGLEAFDEAKAWFARAGAMPPVENWRMETLVRQVGTLIELKWKGKPEALRPAEQALAALVGDEVSIQSVIHGKLGLALSGGGFRASFFHIGVLARLAELDLLRRVEVLSCVSGGSILGAYYYLELRNLLQEHENKDIEQQDYIDLVEKLSHDFLKGVQTNIRTSLLESLPAIARMILPGYTRTHRLGELYEQRLYSRIEGVPKTDSRIHLNDLRIRPPRQPDFNPRYENWRRDHKVPVMLLNAACLNTGHNWQFTVDWMGEAPWSVDTEVDANSHLNWFYYRDAPEGYRNFRLGEAVAASSGVPMLFSPLSLRGLYPDTHVQLADGGVYDNQGVAGLLQQDCDHILVSDASGQLDTQDKPATNLFQVPMRSSEIIQERLRNSQYRELDERQQSGSLKSLGMLHLKKDLHGEQLYHQDHPAQDTKTDQSVTDYHIHPEYQRALAALRTDLDSFSDNEAHALMLSGYNMATKHIPQELRELAGEPRPNNWTFLRLQEAMKGDDPDGELLKQLKTGKHLFNKHWMLAPLVSTLILIPCIMFLAGILAMWTPAIHQALPQVVIDALRWELGLISLVVLIPLVWGLGLLFSKPFNYLYLVLGKHVYRDTYPENPDRL